METKYSVGQILFAIDGKRFNITPYQITEHHVKTSLDGTENSYFAVSGRSKKSVNLSDLQGPIFVSVDDASDYLTRTVAERIKKLVKEALAIAEESFDETPQQEPQISAPVPENLDQDVVVELPDGRQAKLSKGGSYEDFSG